MSRGPLLRGREVRIPKAGEAQVPVPTIEKSRVAAGMRNMWGRKEEKNVYVPAGVAVVILTLSFVLRSRDYPGKCSLQQ
jgi:hypothetical protein